MNYETLNVSCGSWQTSSKISSWMYGICYSEPALQFQTEILTVRLQRWPLARIRQLITKRSHCSLHPLFFLQDFLGQMECSLGEIVSVGRLKRALQWVTLFFTNYYTFYNDFATIKHFAAIKEQLWCLLLFWLWKEKCLYWQNGVCFIILSAIVYLY